MLTSKPPPGPRAAYKPPIQRSPLAVVCCLLAIFSPQLSLPQALAAPSRSTRSPDIIGSSSSDNNNNNQTSGNTNKLQLLYTRTGRVHIPGLYDELTSDGIIPIQGKAQFNRLILGLESSSSDEEDDRPQQQGTRNRTSECLDGENIKRAAQTQTASLVQFYMASCPDCQGFSPYFKRFARDIARPWRKLVQIYTVNCNDFQNIHLCQEQNPRLIVPLVRWYVFPIIQSDTLRSTATSSRRSKAPALHPTCPKNLESFHYPQELLNVAHRQFIEKQRRDLISLRKATLRFVAMTLDELAAGDPLARARKHGMPPLTAQTKRGELETKKLFFETLPAHWHQLAQLGRDQPDDLGAGEQFVMALDERLTRRCLESAAANANKTTASNSTTFAVSNFVIFEDRRSFLGQTLAADWSSWTSFSNDSSNLMMVHRTNDLRLLRHLRLSLDQRHQATPLLVGVSLNVTCSHPPKVLLRSLGELEFKLLASNETARSSNHARARRHAIAQKPRLARIQQRASLERYYSQLNGGGGGGGWSSSSVKRPLRYAAAMSTSSNQVPSNQLIGRRKRGAPAANETQTTTSKADTELQLLKAKAEAENVNWAPEMLHPDEERLRYEFNLKIAQELGLLGSPPSSTSDELLQLVPGSTLKGQNPDEICKPIQTGLMTVDPVEDDLSLMFLTDYYRSLDELVHIDLLSKGHVDGRQLLASSCFLRDLKRHFPFQGNAHGSELIGAKSVARHYIHLLQRAWLEELKKYLKRSLSGSFGDRDLKLNFTQSQVDSLLERLHEGDGCPRLQDLQIMIQEGANETKVAMPLGQISVPSRELEQLQLKIKRVHEVGLAPERHLKWRYCAGSSAYLRGHTCSLWILFHTLTVEEYLARQKTLRKLEDNNEKWNSTTTKRRSGQEYEFQIDYARSPRRQCDPSSPDGAYLASQSAELYVNQTEQVLANIINFVRFYLPCTNCAAHFSCMVEHSSGLDLSGEQPGDSHLLWLWEGHNRVNERTRRTHSEDPARPKHIFPVYGACPNCYLEQPQANATFTSMRFNRHELVKFLVARYRRSGILNNKINIEELHKKP